MENRDLAFLILEERKAEKQKNPKIPLPYYLTNINHPALNGIYKKRGGVNPPGDLERVEWELSLFKPEVIEAIKKKYTERKKKENE